MSDDKPTFASVTNEPCSCGYLERSANDPDSPIVFEDRTGEYQFRYARADPERETTLVIYHCPFCGGAAPKSKRESLFMAIPHAEQQRLRELLAPVQSVDEAIRTLGTPDRDDPQGASITQTEEEGKTPGVQWLRVLWYQHLSEVADVVIDEFPDGRISRRLQAKPFSQQQ